MHILNKEGRDFLFFELHNDVVSALITLPSSSFLIIFYSHMLKTNIIELTDN